MHLRSQGVSKLACFVVGLCHISEGACESWPMETMLLNEANPPALLSAPINNHKKAIYSITQKWYASFSTAVESNQWRHSVDQAKG